MEGHRLEHVEWVASAGGSGFVGTCMCGFKTEPCTTRAETVADLTSHVAVTFSVERRRRWFGRRPVVVDLRDGQLVR